MSEPTEDEGRGAVGDESDASWQARNDRRIELVIRKHGVGLTAREAAELDRLKREVYAHMAAAFPRPTDRLGEQSARLAELRRRLAARREGGAT